MTIESLVHGSPGVQNGGGSLNGARKPSIDVYFTLPSNSSSWGWNMNKRIRPTEDNRGNAAKRMHV